MWRFLEKLIDDKELFVMVVLLASLLMIFLVGMAGLALTGPDGRGRPHSQDQVSAEDLNWAIKVMERSGRVAPVEKEGL